MALKDFEETLYFLEKIKVSDGLGGFTTSWVKGAEFKGVMRKANSQEQLIAEQRGLKEVWILIVTNNIDLDPNDYISYNKNSYRVFTNEDKAPSISTLKTHTYQLEKVDVVK